MLYTAPTVITFFEKAGVATVPNLHFTPQQHASPVLALVASSEQHRHVVVAPEEGVRLSTHGAVAQRQAQAPAVRRDAHALVVATCHACCEYLQLGVVARLQIVPHRQNASCALDVHEGHARARRQALHLTARPRDHVKTCHVGVVGLTRDHAHDVRAVTAVLHVCVDAQVPVQHDLAVTQVQRLLVHLHGMVLVEEEGALRIGARIANADDHATTVQVVLLQQLVLLCAPLLLSVSHEQTPVVVQAS